MQVDGVYFPEPARPDCFFDPTVCNATEFCMADTHEKWGQWTELPDGGTPRQACVNSAYGGFTPPANTTQAKLLRATAPHMCSGIACLETDPTKCKGGPAGGAKYAPPFAAIVTQAWEPGLPNAKPDIWKPSRGVCVHYRQRGESCYATHRGTGSFYPDAFLMNNDATARAVGGSLNRPLVCDPSLDCVDGMCVSVSPVVMPASLVSAVAPRW